MCNRFSCVVETVGEFAIRWTTPELESDDHSHEDELSSLLDEHTHCLGMALSAFEFGNTADGAQWLDAAAETFNRLERCAANVYDDAGLDDTLRLGDGHPFNEQISGRVA